MTPNDVDAELVEKAARATYYADPFYRSVFGKILEPREVLPWDELDLADIQEMRNNARHALAAVLPDIQAQALWEAARDLRAAYKDPPTHVLTVPQQAAWQIGMARAHGIVRDLSRAARLTATTVIEPRDAQRSRAAAQDDDGNPSWATTDGTTT